METNTESSKLRTETYVPNKQKKINLKEKFLMKNLSNLPDKELKVMVIKMLTKIGKRIDELEKRENAKIYQRNQRAEKYKNLSEKHTKGVQKQTR